MQQEENKNNKKQKCKQFLVGKTTPELVKYKLSQEKDINDLTTIKFLTLMVIDKTSVIIKEKNLTFYEKFESGFFSLRQWMTYYSKLKSLDKFPLNEEEGIYFYKCEVNGKFVPKEYRIIFRQINNNGEIKLGSLSIDNLFELVGKTKLLDSDSFLNDE